MALFKKYSKWHPITIYTYKFQDHIILSRINIKTGMIHFKSKKIHGRNKYYQAYNLFDNVLDANEQLLELLDKCKP